MSWAIIIIYINITNFALIRQLEKDHSMIETRRLKNVFIFLQTILSFVLSRKITYSSFFPTTLNYNSITAVTAETEEPNLL